MARSRVAKSWRQFPEDPWAEAERCEVATICKNLAWSRRRLNAELEKATSAEHFAARVAKAAQEFDKANLLAQTVGDNGTGYTSSPWRAMPREAEAVGKDYLGDRREGLVKENRSKDMARNQAVNAARKARPLPERLLVVLADAQRRGVNINRELKNITREVSIIEKRVDRVDKASSIL